jgi:hypothetical protein
MKSMHLLETSGSKYPEARHIPENRNPRSQRRENLEARKFKFYGCWLKKICNENVP